MKFYNKNPDKKKDIKHTLTPYLFVGLVPYLSQLLTKVL